MYAITLESTDFISSNSYGKVARNHALFLARHGFRVSLRSRRRAASCTVSPQMANYLQRLHGRSPGEITVRYDSPDALPKYPDGIFMTPFETANLRSSWTEAATRLRMLFVHCNASRRLFLRAGLGSDRVVTVHHGYDPHIYRPDVKPLEHHGRFTFLYAGHYNARKCIDLLVRAFCKTFRGSEPVQLILYLQPMRSEFDVRKHIERIIARCAGTAKIEVRLNLFDDGVAEDEMGSLYRSGDCLVYPSMGEGFGLPPLEAKACGLEVITTRCGGMCDFLDHRSAHFIEVAQIRPEPACDEINPEYNGLKFWVPSEDSLCTQLRAVYEGQRRTFMPPGWTWAERLERLPAQLERLVRESRVVPLIESREAGTELVPIAS